MALANFDDNFHVEHLVLFPSPAARFACSALTRPQLEQRVPGWCCRCASLDLVVSTFLCCLFCAFLMLPMMIPIIDIPDHCDVKHWVLKHTPHAPQPALLLAHTHACHSQVARSLVSMDISYRCWRCYHQKHCGSSSRQTLSFTAAFHCPRSTAWSPSKIRGGPAACVSTSARKHKHKRKRKHTVENKRCSRTCLNTRRPSISSPKATTRTKTMDEPGLERPCFRCRSREGLAAWTGCTARCRERRRRWSSSSWATWGQKNRHPFANRLQFD